MITLNFEIFFKAAVSSSFLLLLKAAGQIATFSMLNQ
jgi:hypothetical protein